MKMSIMLMIGRSLRQHALSTCITIFSAALASGLVMSVFSIQAQTRQAFTAGSIGFDAVLGARGSQLQLVLNSVFHLETSPGNIPWALYQEIKKDPRVRTAVPYAVGDNYKGFRIVGTTSDLFSDHEKTGLHLEIDSGRLFDDRAREAVIGSYVAQRTGLKTGSIYHPYHGLQFNEKMKHAQEYKVVGVLETTNTSSDRVIWIPIDSFYRTSGHVLRGAGETYQPKAGTEIPDEHKEVSAVMLKLKSPQAGFMLYQTINLQGQVATLAWPIGKVMADLFDKLGWAHQILGLVSYLVLIVVVGAILASIYNTLNERKRDFAILRALGAHRRTIFTLVTGEATVISMLGALLGFLVYGGFLFLASTIIRHQTGVMLETFWFHPSLIIVPLGVTLLGAVTGTIPALKAYQTDVTTNLFPVS